MKHALGIDRAGYAALGAMLAAGAASEAGSLILAGALFASGLFLTFRTVAAAW